MWRILYAIVIAVALSGCAEYMAAAGAFQQQTVKDRQSYNDLKLDTAIAATGDTSIGALSRMETGPRKCGLAMIWGFRFPECQPTVTIPW